MYNNSGMTDFQRFRAPSLPIFGVGLILGNRK